MCLYNRQYNLISTSFELWNLKADLLWRAEHLLQELLNLVDIGLDIPIEGHEGRVRPGSEVVQIGRFSEEQTHKTWVVRKQRISVFLGRLFQEHQPFQVHGGDVEDNPFEPEDHEETLRERTVADAFSITACLWGGGGKEERNQNMHKNRPTGPKKWFARCLDSMFQG